MSCSPMASFTQNCQSSKLLKLFNLFTVLFVRHIPQDNYHSSQTLLYHSLYLSPICLKEYSGKMIYNTLMSKFETGDKHLEIYARECIFFLHAQLCDGWYFPNCKTNGRHVHFSIIFSVSDMPYIPRQQSNLLTMSITVQQDATICSLLNFCKLLHMFRVVTPPIIRSTYNCNYSIWHWTV